MSLQPGKKKMLIGVLIVLAVILISTIVIFPSAKDVYSTTEVKIMEATIVTKELSNNIYYLQVNVLGIAILPLWVDTTQEFYQQASPGQTVGVLLGAVDTYNVKKSLDKRQLSLKYGAANWEVLSLYPSLADAQKENPPKTFTTTASLKQRVKSLDGRYFFLFDAGGKKVMAEVSSEYYQLYTPKTAPIDSFELEFAGIGDFNHLVRIVKP
ncbi:MAG: hypothetical protein CVU90_10070 [Firmicutes bacterium HGW-Firmicutes-15]|nr:MAG: hypothetical protein CVU90_10070 [Firmicutes bacterium HGW-Firmicutes-15]